LKILELQIIKELNKIMGMLANNQKQHKKTTTMELWEKTKKKTIALKALEKSKKKKTMVLRVRPRRRR
jgi:hypothetical protein